MLYRCTTKTSTSYNIHTIRKITAYMTQIYVTYIIEHVRT